MRIKINSVCDKQFEEYLECSQYYVSVSCV